MAKKEAVPTDHVRLFKKNVSQVDYAALKEHANRICSDRFPDDPPILVDETVQNLQSIPPFADLKLWAADRIPGGGAFMTCLEAKKGLETYTNQLCVADLARDLIGSWLVRSQENQAEFDLGFWDGASPEAQIQHRTRF